MFIVVWFDGDHCCWLRDNQKSIGEWFKLERKRIQRQLEAVPQIGDLK